MNKNSEFKTGDRVKVVDLLGAGDALGAGVCLGDILVVERLDYEGCYFRGGITSFFLYNKRLVAAYPNPPHKHAELIKVWADGADIQLFRTYDNMWEDITRPDWSASKYRIKPQRSDKDIQKDEQIERLEQQALDLANENKKLKE